MSCFCNVPLASVQSSISSMQFRFTPPIPPIQLRLAAAFGLAMDPNRADIQIAAILDPIRTPNITLGGSLMSLAMTLQLAGGVFTLDDLPKLEFQMAQAASSMSSNVWPRLSMLTQIQIMPLLNLAIIARLFLNLRLMNIDPMNLATMPAPPANPASTFSFRLSPPKLALGRILIGLPPLFALADTLKIPLGDQNIASTMNNRLQMMARLQPPRISIPLNMFLRIAMVLESLATIRAAFGPDAMTPSGLSRISLMLRPFLRLSLPIPMPVLKLADNLALLPPIPDIKAGAALLNAPNYMAMSFTPPRLAIAPFLNVALALNASLNLMLDAPVLDQCAACNAVGDAVSAMMA